MPESLAEDSAIVYKVFRDAAEAFEIEYDGKKFRTFGPQDAFKSAFEYADNLYDEGIGEDLDDDQVWMLANMAICDGADFILPTMVWEDGKNHYD